MKKNRLGLVVGHDESVALVAAEVLNHASIVRSRCDSLDSLTKVINNKINTNREIKRERERLFLLGQGSHTLVGQGQVLLYVMMIVFARARRRAQHLILENGLLDRVVIRIRHFFLLVLSLSLSLTTSLEDDDDVTPRNISISPSSLCSCVLFRYLCLNLFSLYLRF